MDCPKCHLVNSDAALRCDASVSTVPVVPHIDIARWVAARWVFWADTAATQSLFQSGWFVVGLLT